jgi:HD-GYP domain-containing protein (c-di-GMP phosphodiesterase class II)
MTTEIDRALLESAEGIFKGMGGAILDLQLFSEEHPRFRRSAGDLARAIEEFFKKSPGCLAFTVRRGQAEFRRIPLVNVGPHGERLLKALKAMGAGGLQIKERFRHEDVGIMARTLLDWSRPSADRKQLEKELDLDTFRFLSENLVHELQHLATRGAGDMETDGRPEPHPESAPSAGAGEAVSGAGIAAPEFRVSGPAFRAVLTSYRTVLTSFREGRTFDYDTLAGATDRVLELISPETPVLIPGTSKTYFDDFTFHHSVNVCLLAAAVASRLMDDAEMLRRISMAALVHDVGKSRVPTEILHKPNRLTTSERECLERHPTDGAEMLLSVDHMDPLSVVIAFGHHIHGESGSYPRTRRPFCSDWIAHLVAVVDIYEALTAVRPYKAALSPETAFRVMLDMPGLRHRLGYVKVLYDCVGPYPTGTVVELDSGEWARVVVPNPLFPYRPKVEIFADSRRNRLPEPVVIDLAAAHTAAGGRRPASIRRTVILRDPTDDILDGEDMKEPEEILGAPLGDDAALMAREG